MSIFYCFANGLSMDGLFFGAMARASPPGFSFQALACQQPLHHTLKAFHFNPLPTPALSSSVPCYSEARRIFAWFILQHSVL